MRQKGKLRKFVVTLLAVLLLVPGGFAAPVMAADPDVILYQSFEDDNVGGWTALSWGAEGDTVVSSVYASAGTKSLQFHNRVSNESKLSLNLSSYLESGHTYDISFNIRLGNGSDQFNLASKVVSGGKEDYPWLINPTNVSDDDWTLFERKDYTVPADTTEFIIYLENPTSDADVYIDEFLIVDKTPSPPSDPVDHKIVLTQNFEDDEVGGWAALSWGTAGDTVVSSDLASEGTKSLKFHNRVSNESKLSLNLSSYLESGHTYDISFNIRLGNGSDQFNLASKVVSGGKEDYPWLINPTNVSDDDWTFFERKDYTVPADTTEFIIYLENPTSNADVYIDEFLIVDKTSSPPSDPAPSKTVHAEDFEEYAVGGGAGSWHGNGATAEVTDQLAKSGSNSLLVTGRTQGYHGPALDLTNMLDKGVEYTISGYVRLAPGASPSKVKMTMEQQGSDITADGDKWKELVGETDIAADEWVQLSAKYTVHPDATSIKIYFEVTDATADFALDDFLITTDDDTTPEPQPSGFHETFEYGIDIAKQSGDANLSHVTDKVFTGNDDGAALYVSGRTQGHDAADFEYVSMKLEDGKTYTATIIGYVDPEVVVPAGAQAFLQIPSPPDYPLLASADFVAGEPFVLTAQFTVDTDNHSALRVQSNGDGATVPFYIGDIKIERSRLPALTFETVIFEDGELGGFVARAGTETLVVTDEANHTPGGNYALKVEGRSDTWHGPSLRVEQYIDLGYEYKISAWVKLISPANSQLQLSTQIGDGGNASYNNVQGKTIRTEDGWVLLEGTYRYNSVGDEYVTIYVESSADANASFYIDDISFEATGSGPVDIERDLVPIKDVYKDYFLIGNAFSAKDLEGVRLELLKMHHNVLTAENAMKPGESYSKEPGKERDFDFTDEIALVDKAIAEGFQIVGHTLVWHQQSPEWLWQDSNGNPLSREVALANMRTHIEAAVESVGDKVIAWDVVNEAIDDGLANIDPTDWQGSLRKSGWYNAIGPDYVKEAFLATREVLDDNGWSDVKLYYNDYNDDNQNKATAIYHMVKAINDEYAADNGGRLLIDGIGMQGHYNINVNPNNVERSIERFSSLGVEISITELDITDNMDNNLTEEEAAAQAQLYAQLFQIFKKHKDSIARITFWGLDDASSWRSEGFPLLFDGNLQAKNNYFAVIDPDKYLEDNAPVLPEANHSFANYGTPAIDGKEDPEIWARSPELPINQYQMAWQGATGTARVLWDEDNLYVLVKVTDDQLDNESADAYQQDSVEVFLDEDNAKTSFYQDDDGQYRVNYLNETSFNPASIAAGFESETVVEGTNYTVEMKIPFKKITPAIGHKIGFDVQINDAKGNTRESIANWNDVTGVGYQDTSVFGVLTLIDGMIPPVNLSASAQGSNSIKVDWDFIGQESVTFAVYRATTSSGPFTVVAQDLEETEYIDKGLRSSTTYYYHVVANSAVESSIPSETVWAKTATAPRFDDTPAPTAPEPDIAPNEDGAVIVKPTVTTENGRAKASLSSDNLQQALEQAAVDESGQKKLVIEIEAEEGTDAVDVELPKASLASEEVYVVSLKTPQGTIDVPSNMLDGLDVDAETVTIAVAKADLEGLDEDVRSQIGNRPAISLNVLADGEVVAWNNPQAPVTVAIPYEPTEEELANPDHIIVWYIDGEGNAVAVPNGRYDADSGTVVFRTTHFSTYAINYVVKSFTDLAGAPWAKAAIEAMASRDVIAGVSATSFDPSANIKRADFVALLVRALELQDTGEDIAMFDDVKETYYFYNDVKIAKQLGIANGTGDNHFSPNSFISRQDMMVLADLALQAAGKALQAQEDALDSFPDADDVANYAKASAAKLVANGIVSGTDGKLAPLDQLTRAQAAVILYQLWSK